MSASSRKPFSSIDHSMRLLAARVEDRRSLEPAEPWSATERTQERRDERVAQGTSDFWFFDQTYFSADMYTTGYASPCGMHRDILRFAQTPGVHLVLGPRAHGKTVTGKKVLVWLAVTGRLHVGGTLSHTLPTSMNILADVAALISENPRLEFDFGLEFTELNKEQFALRSRQFRHTVHIAAFSEGKSVRGYARSFSRPQFVLADDLETFVSPLGEDHTRDRIRMVSEAYRSLADGGTLVWMGNNFDERCATNRLKVEAEQGVLPADWRVHVYKAWTGTRPLWPERFPAVTEAELRSMLRVSNEADYQGNDQQNPIPDVGDLFDRSIYAEWHTIPADARGVVIVDPNLSLKSKGDTTAIVHLLYAPSDDTFYIRAARCQSYRDPNDLLDDTMALRDPQNTLAVYFDGNVAQESHWTNHIRAWCRLHGTAFPRVRYHRYNVDTLVKNAQLIYSQGRMLFPPGFQQSEEGRRATAQFYAFSGKKSGRKDDFPDAVICGVEALSDIGFAKHRPPSTSGNRAWVQSVTEPGYF